MARPAKSAKTKSGVIPQEEAAARIAAEDKLRGGRDRIAPAYAISGAQEDIFAFIVREYAAAGVLGNLDSYVLTMTAVAIDRVSALDRQMNDDAHLLTDKEYYTARSKYMSDFWRGCNELCLSPQARAKIGIVAAQAARREKSPLEEALADDDD